MSEITDEKVKEIAEGLISEHQAHQIVYLIGEDDKSIMTTNAIQKRGSVPQLNSCAAICHLCKADKVCIYFPAFV